jgi:UDP-N-acetylglucosamine 4,6-dehydratase/5-epimerase
MNTPAKTILITGGTGFLGRHLGKRLKATGHTVVLGARNNKQNFEASRFSGCDVIPMDVCSMESVRDAVNSVHPHVIIHGAATKFVDLAERQPLECVDVNVVGSQNVARVAIDRGVESLLGISTDKASPPIRNLYGLSKSVMERVFCYLDRPSGTAMACVRYGNVAWSTGSVLPLWKRMLKEGGVIGTTGPHMRRFFFTVTEAVELVVTAIDNMEKIRGRVLGREMKSAMVGDLLEVWKKHHAIRYETIDGRPGERLDEFLVGEQELPFTEVIEFDGIRHFLIGFNQKVAYPLSEVLSSRNAPRLTEEEMLQLIDNPPDGMLG